MRDRLCPLCGYVRPATELTDGKCADRVGCMARRVRRFTGQSGPFTSEYQPPSAKALKEN